MPCIDWPNFTSPDNIGSCLLNFVHEIGLQQFVNEPTRGNNRLDSVLGTRCESAMGLISDETMKHFLTVTIPLLLSICIVKSHRRQQLLIKILRPPIGTLYVPILL